MKIGVFSESYKPYTSGVVTSIATFRTELERKGHEIFIFAPSYPEYKDEENHIYRFSSIPAPSNPNYTLAVPIYPGLGLEVKRLQLDVVHAHSPFTLGRVGLKYARRLHLPMVFTYHTRYDQYVHYLKKAPAFAGDMTNKYSSYFCNLCDHIITPTSDIKNILRNGEVTRPISVIPTGVPLDKFEHGDGTWLKRHYQVPADKKVLLFVGRLTQEKNIPFLVDSFKLIHEQYPASVLVLTAEGPMERELRQQASGLGLRPEVDVIFTGALPYDELTNVYHSADLFVFSSLTETQGLVLVEAMAAGLPVIAVRATGVNDMVSHQQDGLICSPQRREFADQVLQVLNNPVLYQGLHQGALQKAEQMSSRSMAHKLESIYMKLIDKNQQQRSSRLNLGHNFNEKLKEIKLTQKEM